MMQSFALMALITVLWALVGYSPVFRRRRTLHREFSVCVVARVGVAPNADYAATIPQLTFMLRRVAPVITKRVDHGDISSVV